MSRDTFTSLLVLFLCTCAPPPAGNAQPAVPLPDSLPLLSLPEVSVSARTVAVSPAIAAPIAGVTLTELPPYDNTNLLPALNRVAGVRFEERAAASYRVAIRGSSLRAPFGVRNVQVFWNGLPFGEPGGDVPLNFLDAVNVDAVTVIRGPNGGRYGPGTAGTLLLRTDPLPADTTLLTRFRLTTGSFGLLRADLTLARPNRLGNSGELRLGYQRADGYREHNAMARATAQYTAQLGQHTRLEALYTRLDYELPGALNAEEVAENPRQARPGSVATDASIHYDNLLVGLTHQGLLRNWSTETAAYATGFYFDHPFNFDYKREANLGGGGRFSLRRKWKDWALHAGAQAQTQYRMAQNFTNVAGRTGTLEFADEIVTEQGFVFGQLGYTPGRFDVQADLSSSALRYRVDRTFAASGDPGKTTFTTTRPLALRLAVGYRTGSHYAYVARADGFSPPTLDEFRTNEGSLNVGLRPEIGSNYEVGYRFFQDDLRLEVIAFHFALDEAITTFADARGTRLFRNAGRTRQQGLEVSLTHPAWWRGDKARLSGLLTWTAYRFRYRDLQRGGTDVSGQRIPGAAPHTLNLEIGWKHQRGWFASVFHNFTDATPLTDANDIIADSFHLLRLTAGFRRGRYEIFASGNNLLNDELNLGYDLNVRFGGRFFQPAPGPSWQAGVALRL